MKSLTLMLVTWVMILQLPVWALRRYELNLEGTTTAQYSRFLKRIRNDVKDSNLIYGGTDIPVIKANPYPEFLRVDLKDSTGTVSLAVRRSNLYVQAYLAKNDEDKFRVYYFKDKISMTQIDGLFKEAQGGANRQPLEYTDSYPAIEFNAKMTRKEAGLGIKRLADFMAEVNGKKRDIISEARFILLAAAMVAEAARFKYIEEYILEDIDVDIESPKNRVILLENNWRRLSAATKASNEGTFIKPLTLNSYAVSSTWKVKTVNEVKLGILLNIPDPPPPQDTRFQ